MDMLYFGDSVPYPSYPNHYKQGFNYNPGEFNSSCAYQSVGVGMGDMGACRFNSVSSMSPAYAGMYAFQQASCAGLFARKAGRIKGNIFSVNYHDHIKLCTVYIYY